MAVMDILRDFAKGTFGGNNAGGPVTPPNANPMGGGNNQVSNTQVNPNDPSNNNPGVPGDQTKLSDGSHPAFPQVDQSKSPLDTYADLWQPVKDAPAPQSIVPNFQIDPAAIMAQAGKMDFTKSLKAEDLANAAKGDATALASIINQAAQAGFAHATISNGNIIKEALTRQSDTFYKTVVPDLFRRNDISTQVRESNPAFENPAMQPIVQAVERQLLQKYPTASAAEITKHAQTVLAGMAGEIITGSGKTVTDPKAATSNTRISGFGQSEPTDWDSWITS